MAEFSGEVENAKKVYFILMSNFCLFQSILLQIAIFAYK